MTVTVLGAPLMVAYKYHWLHHKQFVVSWIGKSAELSQLTQQVVSVVALLLQGIVMESPQIVAVWAQDSTYLHLWSKEVVLQESPDHCF